MKIALTIESFSAARGGGETYARRFAQALVAAGHEVHVFAGEQGEPMPEITFHLAPMPRTRTLRRYRFAKRVCRALRGHDFDLVHGFGKSLCMDVFRPGGGCHRAWMEREIMAIEGDLPRLVRRVRRSLSLDQLIIQLMESYQFRKEGGPHVIAVSKMTRDDILHHYELPPERVTVIYNGVDLRRFCPENRPRFRTAAREEAGLCDELAILFVANNFRLKGLHKLIRALALVRERGADFKLLVAGRGGQRPFRRLACRLGCDDHLVFLGATSEMPRLYAAADLLAHPSFYDPCANVCLEALATGIPVVTSPFNGSGELITEGREGFVVDPSDVRALADALLKCFDPDFRDTAGAAARRLAEAHSVEHNVQEVLELYGKIDTRHCAGMVSSGANVRNDSVT